MRPFARIAAVAAIGVVAIGGSLYLAERGFPSFGVEPSADPTTTPTAGPPTTPVPSASTLPGLGLPGTRADAAGEYGWTGEPGWKGGLHKVVMAPSEPDGARQTQLVFVVADDCFPRAGGADPAPRTVAGLGGSYLEPYEDPSVQFVHRPGVAATTGAYALPVGDRTLCVYLTWDAATPAAELSAAREVVESIRAQPFGTGIRINFTLDAGWDVG